MYPPDSYVVLSRKYRPRRLKNLIGQPVLAEFLQNSIDNKHVPHAFLFHGTRGVGKTTTARILARCLNCLGESGCEEMTSAPCGVCKSCRAMDQDNHLDIAEIDAASRTGIDDVREIIESVRYSPVVSRYKIFIIDEVHMLSKSAFNALLKTLEEPPEHAKFIFATTEAQKVPDTILSRCMVFGLKNVSCETIASYLIEVANAEGFAIDQSTALLIASEADGSVRDALSILEQSTILSFKKMIIESNTVIKLLGGIKTCNIEELLDFILDGKTKSALQKIESILSDGADVNVVCKNVQTALYRLIESKVSKADSVKYDLSNLLYIWQIFVNQLRNIRYGSYSEHVLQAAIVIMSHTSSFSSVIDLMNAKDYTTNSCPTEHVTVNNIKKNDADNSQLIKRVLQKFPGSIVTEIE
jgi:DNA polymerase-3 subunit gamma/tau